MEIFHNNSSFEKKVVEAADIPWNGGISQQFFILKKVVKIHEKNIF